MTPAHAWRAAASTIAATMFAVLMPAQSHGHGLEPALLSLREIGAGRFEVIWQSSAARLPGADVQPILPSRCATVSTADAGDGGDRVRRQWVIDCGREGVVGETVAVADLSVAKIDALLRIERLDGEVIETVLSARAPSFTIPAHPSRADVLRSYATLGFEHILTGPDHLLFVFGLLLLAPVPRRLLQTVTAFTVGHSITLSAAALHVTAVPARPVEVLIAVSVLILAVELARQGSQPTLLRRFPWAMAAAFGLLHGFGFAGALTEAGLPAGDIPLALVSFNSGIEIGQLAFVGTLLLGGVLLTRAAPRAATRSARVAVYAMGILAAFWCFQRLAVWLA